MLRPTTLALVPGCVALILVAAVLVVHLLRPPITVAAVHFADVGRYQLRFRCGLELVETQPAGPDALVFDSAMASPDSVTGER